MCFFPQFQGKDAVSIETKWSRKLIETVRISNLEIVWFGLKWSVHASIFPGNFFDSECKTQFTSKLIHLIRSKCILKYCRDDSMYTPFSALLCFFFQTGHKHDHFDIHNCAHLLEQFVVLYETFPCLRLCVYFVCTIRQITVNVQSNYELKCYWLGNKKQCGSECLLS